MKENDFNKEMNGVLMVRTKLLKHYEEMLVTCIRHRSLGVLLPHMVDILAS